MLVISNLHASIDGSPILKGLDLTVEAGKVHAIMGPNGSGKSTLAKVIAGHDDYEITEGSITYEGVDLLEMSPEERACAGIFLGFQYPVEIPGVSNNYFIKAAVNAVRTARGETELDAFDFLSRVKAKMKLLDMDASYKGRQVNVGFSGGEKKRNEILQLVMLEPKLAVLDETDSGLDIDALRIVAAGVNSLRDEGRGFLLITHYQRLLDHIEPDVVHVMVDGRIAESGDKSLALQLEERGYADFERAAS